MSEAFLVVDVTEWVERARPDPALYIERQAIEIFLSALSLIPEYEETILLKGGALMGLVYDSPRQTADVDFTAMIEPSVGFVDELKQRLERNLPVAAARVGSPDLLCQVQSVELEPWNNARFVEADFPAMTVRIGYAIRGTAQEKRLKRGQATTVIEAEISFREPVDDIQHIRFKGLDSEISAYSLIELISEKFRALLQQKIRNRGRR